MTPETPWVRNQSQDGHTDVTFMVPMAPRQKDRPRFGRGNAYTDTPGKEWAIDFAWYARAALRDLDLAVAVRVDTLHVKARPARLPKGSPSGLVWAPVKPDKDNVEKAVLDALKAHWTDDALVVCGEPLKCYAETGGAPRVVVRIRTLEGVSPDVRARELGLL